MKSRLVRNEGGVWGADPEGEGDTLVLRSTEQRVDGSWAIEEPAMRRLSASEAEAARLDVGDLVITKSSGSEFHIGKTSLVTPEVAALGACYSNFMQRLRTDARTEPRFVHYVLNNTLAREQFTFLSNSTSGLANLNAGLIGELRIAFPTLAEQQRIANFLDEQTARIDALIAEKEALLERLDELRLSTIYAYLTFGLDGAECRRTNDEWFPTVPSHWSFCALNYRYEVQLGKMLDEKRQAGVHSTPYLRNVDVRWDHVNANDLPLIDVAPDERERYTVNAGDLLVCEGGVGVGRTALWTGQDGVVAYQKALHRLRPRGRFDIPRYVLYLMRDAVARGRVLGAEKATIPHLTAESFRRWRFPFPSEKEQRRIVEALDGVSKHCDQLGAHCREHIARLREYRSSLISAAVTGQLDVSAYRLPAAEELATT